MEEEGCLERTREKKGTGVSTAHSPKDHHIDTLHSCPEAKHHASLILENSMSKIQGRYFRVRELVPTCRHTSQGPETCTSVLVTLLQQSRPGPTTTGDPLPAHGALPLPACPLLLLGHSVS